jgi:hypothetical protein
MLEYSAKRPLILDIETVPIAAHLEMPYPLDDRSPPTTSQRTAESITRWREKDRAKWTAERAKQCSLNPRLGRVLVIGTSVETLVVDDPAQEAAALTRFWELAHGTGGRVVTWNGSWDLRFLVIRSLAHRVMIPLPPSTVQGWFKRYVTFPHYDCKAVLMNWDTAKAGDGLNEWATFFGLEGKADGMTGADVWPMYQAGRLEDVVRYCEQDVALTAAIYQRIAAVLA